MLDRLSVCVYVCVCVLGKHLAVLNISPAASFLLSSHAKPQSVYHMDTPLDRDLGLFKHTVIPRMHCVPLDPDPDLGYSKALPYLYLN